MENIKQYKVQFNEYKQFNETRKKEELHRATTTSLPADFLKEIGVSKEYRNITVELDLPNNCLIIKRG